MCIIGKNYRIHIVFNKILKIVVVRNGEILVNLFLLLQSFLPFVTNRNHLSVIRNCTIIDHAASTISAHDADSDFSVCHIYLLLLIFYLIVFGFSLIVSDCRANHMDILHKNMEYSLLFIDFPIGIPYTVLRKKL